jgi:hypothetical protein
MTRRTRILLKTTIGAAPDDWNIGRFSSLADFLASLTGKAGEPMYAVTARDRIETNAGDDADLGELAGGAYDQLWLFAVDTVGALTGGDVDNIAAFRARGGGVFLTRDHQDLGACLTHLGPLGATQYFQTSNPEPDPSRQRCDDIDTATITWPNYHSGANGDLQDIETVAPLHPLMRRTNGDAIRRLPSHPHEGAVGVPESLRDVAWLAVRG